MSSVLTLGAAKKAAGDKVRLSIDFGNEPAVVPLLVDSAGNYNYTGTPVTFTAYDVQCSGVGAPTVSSIQLDYAYSVSALVEGGSTGTYDLQFTATVADGDGTELSRTGTLEIV